MSVVKLTAGQLHRVATRTALLRRHVYPGSLAWDDFFPRAKRDWCDVSVNDLRRILARPDKYAPTDGDLREILSRGSRPFLDPDGPARSRHHVNKINEAYGTVASGNGGINSLGSSSTWVAGFEWYTVDNTAAADAGLQLDWNHQQVVQVGTTPTTATEIRSYLVGSADGSTWPDVFAGSAAARTLTSAGVGSGFLALGRVTACDSTTSNRNYPIQYGTRSTFGGVVPKKFSVFITHNTGVALNATAGNQTWIAAPEYVTFT